MVAKQISEWILFQSSDDAPIAPELYRPLIKAPGCITGFKGRVQERPDWHYLVTAWESREAHEAFKSTSAYAAVLSGLKDLSGTAATAYTVDYQNVIFWPALGSNTELRTVYFATPLSASSKEAVMSLRGLIMPHGLGIGGQLAHLSPYRKVPICGWIEGDQTFKGKDAVACVWIHSWADKNKEREFKENKRRPPRDGEDTGPLIIDAWEQELTDLGALGWEDVHVDFAHI